MPKNRHKTEQEAEMKRRSMVAGEVPENGTEGRCAKCNRLIVWNGVRWIHVYEIGTHDAVPQGF